MFRRIHGRGVAVSALIVVTAGLADMAQAGFFTAAGVHSSMNAGDSRLFVASDKRKTFAEFRLVSDEGGGDSYSFANNPGNAVWGGNVVWRRDGGKSRRALNEKRRSRNAGKPDANRARKRVQLANVGTSGRQRAEYVYMTGHDILRLKRIMRRAKRRGQLYWPEAMKPILRFYRLGNLYNRWPTRQQLRRYGYRLVYLETDYRPPVRYWVWRHDNSAVYRKPDDRVDDRGEDKGTGWFLFRGRRPVMRLGRSIKQDEIRFLRALLGAPKPVKSISSLGGKVYAISKRDLNRLKREVSFAASAKRLYYSGKSILGYIIEQYELGVRMGLWPRRTKMKRFGLRLVYLTPGEVKKYLKWFGSRGVYGAGYYIFRYREPLMYLGMELSRRDLDFWHRVLGISRPVGPAFMGGAVQSKPNGVRRVRGRSVQPRRRNGMSPGSRQYFYNFRVELERELKRWKSVPGTTIWFYW